MEPMSSNIYTSTSSNTVTDAYTKKYSRKLLDGRVRIIAVTPRQ